jgi:hypothetical protein
LSVELGPSIHNLSAGDIVFLVTRKSGLVRVGKIRPVTDILQIVPLNSNNLRWDVKFLQDLKREGEEIYIALSPVWANNLDPKLRIELSVPFNDQPYNSYILNQQHRDDKPPVEDLPSLFLYPGGRVDAGALQDWLTAANELIQGQPGLNFGKVDGSLPDGLGVSHVDYQPGFIIYEVGVFPIIDGVIVAGGRAGKEFMIDLDAKMNRGAGGLFTRLNHPDRAEEAVENVEEKKFIDFTRELAEGKEQNKRMVLSVVSHDLGIVVVDNMEVESIKRVCKKGKKLYRLFLQKQSDLGGGLNSCINAGYYGECSLWCWSWTANN